ncbi:hypothetical protein I7I51_05808 [Histoplasma capsulatum]|uniref:Uncharacterized protein n=1 Tax=Ajellomyces capsulatus TaxID=5037 RepID=A0A8A1M4S9_AJECA|nr:hypothetical protein I7I51_05808 [Histoplasma capsulatum]
MWWTRVSHAVLVQKFATMNMASQTAHFHLVWSSSQLRSTIRRGGYEKQPEKFDVSYFRPVITPAQLSYRAKYGPSQDKKRASCGFERRKLAAKLFQARQWMHVPSERGIVLLFL